MVAASKGALKIVNHLIEQGASHGIRDHEDHTALHYAVSGRSVQVVASP